MRGYSALAYVVISLTLAYRPVFAQIPYKLLGTVTGTVNIALLESADKKLMLRTGDSLGKYKIKLINKRGVELVKGTEVIWLPLKQRESPGQADLARPPISVSIHKTLLKNIAQDPQKWLSAVHLEPVVEEGWLNGYRIMAITAPELVAHLNLQVNDVIRSINGVDVRQAAAFSALVNGLEKATDVIFTLNRGSKLIQIHFSVLH